MNADPYSVIAPELLASGALRDRLCEVRARSEDLAQPLSPEDAQIQSMPDTSPAKWHLAHTTWFFETFVLRAFDPGFAPFDPQFHFLFNSYYEAEGDRHPRPLRGMLTRPTLATVAAYRTAITERVVQLIERFESDDNWLKLAALIELGCHHEEQHQELLLTDIKHALAQNPLAPAYAERVAWPAEAAPQLGFRSFDSGLYEIGHAGDAFAFDNELPRHPIYIRTFALASRAVTNGEYGAFIEDGGYREPRHWLAQGWDWVKAGGRAAPLYWRWRDGAWSIFTLHGARPIDENEPVAHLSYYEADAYACWAGARLPREEELEVARQATVPLGSINDLGSGRLHPAVARHVSPQQRFAQLVGDVWEWTLSSYAPFPGYAPAAGALGEYNGKFMCGQYVLKGGSCLTPPGHARASYRNFFPPEAQWQMTGLRLAKDL